ncbi:MAG: hypothetical protein NC418_05745 [Muribaculaceae bacterium]|nr:hypothetical protein [Muribaculaceae bacterium]
MARLLYFFPENDLALARNIARYTAPPAAVKLRMSGATLPLWYGDPADRVLLQGVNSAWLSRVSTLFDIAAEPYDYRRDGLTPAPWGWSKASRQSYLDLDFTPDELPDDARLDRLRMLSHRRTASEVAALLAEALPFAIAPAAVELDSIEAVEDFVRAHAGGAVLKLPWSSSGRGLVATDEKIFAGQRAMIEGMLRRQGSVTAEPRYTKRLDFALLYTMHHGRCRFDGYSVFDNTQLGSYAGNRLAPPHELEATIAQAGDPAQLARIREALPPILEKVAACYEGPLGVDMMAVDASGYCYAPVVEINFRMTMGHLCRIFYERHVSTGATGTFRVGRTEAPGRIDAATAAGRMHGGTIDLAQPGSHISFTVALD